MQQSIREQFDRMVAEACEALGATYVDAKRAVVKLRAMEIANAYLPELLTERALKDIYEQLVRTISFGSDETHRDRRRRGKPGASGSS